MSNVSSHTSVAEFQATRDLCISGKLSEVLG